MPEFRKPKRFDRNIVVIGAGSAGLVAAYIAAAVRAKVTLVERGPMGGDCLNTGCIPSKALIRSAKLLAQARDAARYGFRSIEVEFDFAEVMERVQRVISEVAPHDSVERYTALGVECLHGNARMTSPWTVDVDGRTLSTRSIIIAAGASPFVPPIPGIDEMGVLTSDNLWSLRELPRRLLVLGGGPIGCELAQCFARFGSRVTQVEMTQRLLVREDPDVSKFIEARFREEGVEVLTGHTAVAFRHDGTRRIAVLESSEGTREVEFDQVLAALGRRPVPGDLGLEELGIGLAPQGTIEHNAFLQTCWPNVYVCGDVAGPYQFTHTASHQAWYAAVNALLDGLWRKKADYSVIPWATFTDPEVARVGLNQTEALQQRIPVDVSHYGIEDLDRAIADGTASGFVKVLTAAGSDRILGATLVGPHAGDLIVEFTSAMRHRIGLNRILGTIHVYPTLSEANKYAAGVWKREHAPRKVLDWLERLHRWRRGG